ncbi:MAG TPA: hypothetical protein VD965_11485 [Burkholderiales bacterium]|nr:hypothetical protein [Burkholderiales bacterium]
MSQYDDTNRGALFKNAKKDSDNHPDYKGSVNVEGVEYWVSSWLKVSKAGEKYLSLSLTAKDAPKSVSKPAPRQSRDEDVPF